MDFLFNYINFHLLICSIELRVNMKQRQVKEKLGEGGSFFIYTKDYGVNKQAMLVTWEVTCQGT